MNPRTVRFIIMFGCWFLAGHYADKQDIPHMIYFGMMAIAIALV